MKGCSHVKVAVAAENQAFGTRQSMAGGEDVHEGARLSIVAEDTVRIPADYEEVSVRPKGQIDSGSSSRPRRQIRPPLRRSGPHIEEPGAWSG